MVRSSGHIVVNQNIVLCQRQLLLNVAEVPRQVNSFQQSMRRLTQAQPLLKQSNRRKNENLSVERGNYLIASLFFPHVSRLSYFFFQLVPANGIRFSNKLKVLACMFAYKFRFLFCSGVGISQPRLLYNYITLLLITVARASLMVSTPSLRKSFLR